MLLSRRMIKIAIVEDELDMANDLIKYTKDFFNKNEIEVNLTHFDNALKLLDNYNYEFDLIFMDINMYGMNGYETTQKIRRMNRKDAKTVLIFAVSADIQVTYKEKALEAGMNGCICKPFSYNDIIKQMHRLLEEKEGEEDK